MYQLHLQEGNNVQICKLRDDVNLTELEAELNRTFEERLNGGIYFFCAIYRKDGMDFRQLRSWEITVY